jgi:hypothetical protein
MIFRLKEDWLYESTFFNKKSVKKIYEKDHLFIPEDNIYKIENHVGEIINLTESEMKSIDILESVSTDYEIIIQEIDDEDDNFISNWRIQLDVKTTRRKLKEFERKFRESINSII